jgi:type I restriction enzyme S subunit
MILHSEDRDLNHEDTKSRRKYKAYPSYKDSGVEWANVLPSHWRRVSLRWVSKMYAGGTPSKNIEEYWENGTVPWLNSGAVNQGLVAEASTYITQNAYKNSSAKWIPKNALVMALAGQGKTKGMVAQLGFDTTCNQSMAAIVPNALSDSRYLFWWLTFNYQNIRNMSGGDNRDGLNLELLGNIECPIPTDEEKDKIANFLDHETAKIDLLIEKQQQLIQLLKEKRQAVISHAVTKGLNPNVPMKESGVEWLGEVPVDWSTTPLKLVVRTRKGVAFKSVDFCEVGIRVVKASDIKKKTIRATDVFLPERFEYEYPKALLNSSDIILSTVGSNPEVKNSAVGQIGMVPKELTGSLLNQNTVVFDPDETKLLREYLFYILQMEGYRDHLDLHAHGTANQSSLSISDMLNFSICFPPIEEQTEVCTYLRKQEQKLSDLELRSRDSETLLRERRTALISAAVTGKIDVRDWQAPKV